MTGKEQIPLMDLVTPNRELEEEFIEVFREIVRSARFIGGPHVEGFEREFAHFCGVEHCVGVGSGTDAVRFALMAANLEDGGVVLTTPMTFAATTEAISQAGLVPDFVDISAETYTLDPVQLERYLKGACERASDGRWIHKKSNRTVVGVVPVHLYGHMADMDPILQLADGHGLVVIEDAAQAHGARYQSALNGSWQEAGSMGLAAGFSFYPGKNLGACGEAGAVTTNDAELANRVRMIRDHGQSKKYLHEIEGYNGRLDALQAAALRIKLRRLPVWTKRRQALAKNYDDLLSGILGVTTPEQADWAESVYHLYVIRSKSRDALAEQLEKDDIGTGLHYPIPLHLQPAYARLEYKVGDFPVSEQVAREVLSLPLFPELTEQQQEGVAEAIRTLQMEFVESP